MTSTPPGEMLSAVLDDLKSRRLTQLDIADKTGYKTRQAISAIFSSGKYMTQQQARRFADAFGYYEGYLTMGIGSLRSPESPEDNKTSFVSPKMIVTLEPYENKEDFRKALDNLIESSYILYGEEAVRRFLNTFIRYLMFHDDYDKKLERTIRNITANDPRLQDGKLSKEDLLKQYQTQEYRDKEITIRENILDSLFRQYCIMVEEK